MIHLIFCSGFILDEGESVLDVFGESPNSDVHVSSPLRLLLLSQTIWTGKNITYLLVHSHTQPDGRFSFLDAEHRLYNDTPPTEAKLWASRLIPQSYKVQTTKMTRAAWRYIPSTYVVAERDQALPPQVQRAFAKRIRADVVRLETGHCPMLSAPGALAKTICEVARRALEGRGFGKIE